MTRVLQPPGGLVSHLATQMRLYIWAFKFACCGNGVCGFSELRAATFVLVEGGGKGRVQGASPMLSSWSICSYYAQVQQWDRC